MGEPTRDAVYDTASSSLGGYPALFLPTTLLLSVFIFVLTRVLYPLRRYTFCLYLKLRGFAWGWAFEAGGGIVLVLGTLRR